MKDLIIEDKAREKEGLSEAIADTITPAEVTQASNLVDVARKYI